MAGAPIGYLEVILGVIGGATGGLLIAAGLAKRLVDIQVSRVTEKYKSELEQKSSMLKTELSIYAHEQNVGISRIDQQRSQAICEIYGAVTKWHETLIELTMPSEPELPDDLLVKRYYNLSTALMNSAEAVTKQLYSNAIFFQNTSHKLIGDFGIEAMELSCRFHNNTFEKMDYPSVYPQEMLRQIRQERLALLENFKGDFDQMREQLIQEFRILLKVERQDKQLIS